MRRRSERGRSGCGACAGGGRGSAPWRPERVGAIGGIGEQEWDGNGGIGVGWGTRNGRNRSGIGNWDGGIG